MTNKTETKVATPGQMKLYTIETMIQSAQSTLTRSEIMEGYFTRKTLLKQDGPQAKQHEMLLAKTQAEKKNAKELLDYLLEVRKDIVASAKDVETKSE